MEKYRRDEARDWARERFRGVVNVIIPSFTEDLSALNEAGIRHDVRRDVELGFSGALLVAETATTDEEYLQFVEWSVDEAGDSLLLGHHASFDTLDANIRMVKAAEAAGASFVLLSYPPSFYPEGEREIYDYTRAFCEATNLAVVLFPIPLWGFERVHEASMSMGLLDRLLDDVPNVAAIKAEGGFPSIGGFTQVWNRFADRVVVTMPVEQHAIPLATLVPMQVIATSNTEYYGSTVPTMLQLVHDGKLDEAMDLFWQIAPARRANNTAANATPVAHLIHRMAWKYQAWLNGFNGGPLRMPTMRLVDSQMRALRNGLVQSGLEVTGDTDSTFFVGRNPA